MASLEFDGAAMSSALDLFFAEQTEPALDHVQPRGRGWREVRVEPWGPGKPALHRGSLVRAVVVHHQMYVQRLRHVCIDGAQELKEFLGAVASVKFSDDLAGGHVQRSKQRGGPVPHVS